MPAGSSARSRPASRAGRAARPRRPRRAAGAGAPDDARRDRSTKRRSPRSRRSPSREPNNAKPRVELGNLYFDAERYDDAIKWYDEALKLTPNDVNVSTDLGVCYYYTNQPDKALAQFDHSLKLDPKHAKTLLNVGIVKAFGKQDLDGAMQAWQQVIAARARQPGRPGGQARARQLAVGASGRRGAQKPGS